MLMRLSILRSHALTRTLRKLCAATVLISLEMPVALAFALVLHNSDNSQKRQLRSQPSLADHQWSDTVASAGYDRESDLAIRPILEWGGCRGR